MTELSAETQTHIASHRIVETLSELVVAGYEGDVLVFAIVDAAVRLVRAHSPGRTLSTADILRDLSEVISEMSRTEAQEARKSVLKLVPRGI